VRLGEYSRQEALALLSALLRETGVTGGGLDALVRLADRCALERDRPLLPLQARWYDSVAAGAPDFSVYDEPVYAAAAFSCWWVYSRVYVRTLSRYAPVATRLARATTIADLGCGIGFSTAMAAAAWPSAQVIGTNRRASLQYRIGERLGRMAGFTVTDEIPDADVVLAFEYFEHFEDPTAHLAQVLEAARPRLLLTANTFNSPAVGHFEEYRQDGGLVRGRAAGRGFGKALRAAGYRKVETSLWNQRPTLWEAT
jgi:hypothetical protein